MSIEKVTVARTVCDACGNIRYANEDGILTSGFSLAVIQHTSDGELPPVSATACKAAHIGKAAKVVIERERDDEMDRLATKGFPYDDGSDLPSPVTPELSAEWGTK